MTKEKDRAWMEKALEEEERVEHGLPADEPADPVGGADDPVKPSPSKDQAPEQCF
jgi:hypothetical protein